jgi:hypothetical protein
MEKDALCDTTDGASVIFDEEDPEFQNLFASKKHDSKPGTSKQPRQPRDQSRQEALPHHSLPKIHFPKLDGSNPKIWFNNYVNYFTIYAIPEELKVIAVTMHLEDNASKWWQAYKQNHAIPEWKVFYQVI